MRMLLFLTVGMIICSMLGCTSSHDTLSSSCRSNSVESIVDILKYGHEYSSNNPSRVDAAIALGVIGSQSAVPGLSNVYQYWLKQNDNVQLRGAIIRSLGWIGGDDAAPVIINSLKNDPDEYIRGDAIEALAKNNYNFAVPIIEKALKDPSCIVRRDAAQALKRMTGKDYKYSLEPTRSSDADSCKRLREFEDRFKENKK